MAASKVALMPVLRVARSGIARPFGDERTVNQAFPSVISAEEADPFLMCDYFDGPFGGKAKAADDFPIGWHPHAGQSVCTYMRVGTGRHGDSLGNRETFEAPGMQWMTTGSGVEHAEGGASEASARQQGFQIWINLPSKHKFADPVYGTEPADKVPLHEVGPGVTARLLAGPMGGRVGALKTYANIQMVDFDIASGSTLFHEVPAGMDTAILYVYEGQARVEGHERTLASSIVQFDAESADKRALKVTAVGGAAAAILFAGTKLREPIAWHGPIVMNTQKQLHEVFGSMQRGTFPPKRVAWDYKRISTKPAL